MENTARDQAYSLFSDLFKDAHGVRPRHCGDWTLEQFEAAIAELSDSTPEPDTSDWKEIFDF